MIKKLTDIIGTTVLGLSLTLGYSEYSYSQNISSVEKLNQQLSITTFKKIIEHLNPGIFPKVPEDINTLLRYCKKKDFNKIDEFTLTNLNFNKKYQARSFIAEGWNDSNSDGMFQIEEVYKDNKRYCDKLDSLIIGMNLDSKIDKKDKSGTLMVFSPGGEEIVRKTYIFKTLEEENFFMNISPKVMFDNIGPGRYIAMFTLNNEFIEARGFEVYSSYGFSFKPRSGSFLCNDIKKENDKIINIIGMNKTVFKSDENLKLVLGFDSGEIVGNMTGLKVYNPNGKVILNDWITFNKDFSYIEHEINVENVLKENREGLYHAVFYYNDKVYQIRQFLLFEKHEN